MNLGPAILLISWEGKNGNIYFPMFGMLIATRLGVHDIGSEGYNEAPEISIHIMQPFTSPKPVTIAFIIAVKPP